MDRWAVSAKEKLGTMPTAQLLIEAQRAALACGHTFTKYTGQTQHELLDFEDEVRELCEAVRQGHDVIHLRNEIGDVMFHLLNFCRAKGINFDDTLGKFAERWLARKALQEEKILAAGFTWTTIPLEMNEHIWRDVKAELKQKEYGA